MGTEEFTETSPIVGQKKIKQKTTMEGTQEKETAFSGSEKRKSKLGAILQ